MIGMCACLCFSDSQQSGRNQIISTFDLHAWVFILEPYGLGSGFQKLRVQSRGLVDGLAILLDGGVHSGEAPMHIGMLADPGN